eukprot:COSAG01_NODE_9742_length_2357_cov_3.294951_1_plen_57_part_10
MLCSTKNLSTISSVSGTSHLVTFVFQVTCVWCARQNCDFLSSFAEFSRVSRIQSLLK